MKGHYVNIHNDSGNNLGWLEYLNQTGLGLDHPKVLNLSLNPFIDSPRTLKFARSRVLNLGGYSEPTLKKKE